MLFLALKPPCTFQSALSLRIAADCCVQIGLASPEIQGRYRSSMHPILGVLRGECFAFPVCYTTYCSAIEWPARVFVKQRRKKHTGNKTESSKVPADTKKMSRSIKLTAWKAQKEALVKKFKGDGWQPRKKLSPDALEMIRGLHREDPERNSTENLSNKFKGSPEAVRSILKSKCNFFYC